MKIMPLARRKCPHCFQEHPVNEETQSLEVLFLQEALTGKFEILVELNRRASGTLFLAQDLILDRKVAVKAIKFPKSASEALVEKWKQNLRRCLRLEEPHLARIYTFGITGSLHYIILEYIPAETLEDILLQERSSLPIWKSLRIGRDIALGLHAAHNQGITHHRLKPSNIAVTQNVFSRILDLGAAQGTIEALENKPWSIISDTSLYFAPEQIESGYSDPQSDQYRLAVCLYHALTGKPPFIDPGEKGAFQRMHSEPEPLTAKNPSIPEELNKVILKALSRNPDDRFSSCLEFARQLEALEPDYWLPEIEPGFRGATKETTVALILEELHRIEQSRDFQRALFLLEQALALAPYNSEVIATMLRIQKLNEKEHLLHSIVNKALIAFYAGSLNDALNILKSGRQIDKDHPEILRLTNEVMQEQERIRLSNILLDAAKIDLAKHALSAAMANVIRVLDLNPKNEHALKLKQRIEFEMEDRAALGILLSQAETAYEKSQFDEAEAIVKKIQETDPDNISAGKIQKRITQQKRHKLIMHLWESMDNEFQIGRYRKAIAILKQIAQLEPSLKGDIRNRLIRVKEKIQEQANKSDTDDTRQLRSVRPSDLTAASSSAENFAPAYDSLKETSEEFDDDFRDIDTDAPVESTEDALSDNIENEPFESDILQDPESLVFKITNRLKVNFSDIRLWTVVSIILIGSLITAPFLFKKTAHPIQNTADHELSILNTPLPIVEPTSETVAADNSENDSLAVFSTVESSSSEADIPVSDDKKPELPEIISHLLLSAKENERIGNMNFAAVLYREVLKTVPENTDALKGLERCKLSLGK